MNTMTRKEFEELAKKNNWETFTQRQVYQFSQELLKSVDPKEREWGAIDFVSLNRQEVINDNLTKSVVFWREQQVIWDKAENGELMKARSGVYADTPVNRKKGIVGQKYGKEKKGTPLKTEITRAQFGGDRKEEVAGEIAKIRFKMMKKYEHEGSHWEEAAHKANEPDMKRYESLNKRYYELTHKEK